VDILETMTPLQFGTFRDRLDAASGFQSAQFRELEIVLGRRDDAVLASFLPGSPEHDRLSGVLTRPGLWHHTLTYLASRSNSSALEEADSAEVRDVVLNAYRNDPEAALVLERLVDIDEGLQEWRYRHVKMVERTIGRKHGTGGSSGAEYLMSTLFRPVFPELWNVRNDF
jgi:tryptophan 2,3-dioxygenase